MSRYKKLFSDTVILGIGTIGSKLLVFLLMPFYTAWLTAAEYGTADLITTTANLLIPVACVGISTGIFRFAAERGTDQREVFSSSVVLLLGGLAAFLALSPLLCLIPLLDGNVWLVVLYVVLADLQTVCAQYVRAIDRPRLFALQGILNTVLTIGFNVLFLAVCHFGITGYVLSVILGNLLTTVFLFFAGKLWQVFRFSSVSRKLMGELLRFSLPMIPTTVCWLITDLSDRYMVTWFCGEAANGIYSAAYKIPTIVNLVSGIFLQAWQFSAVAESSDEKSCRNFYSEIFGGYLSVILIGSSLLILLSRFLTGILLASGYQEAHRFMPTLLLAVTLEAMVSFLATVYMVKKKSMHSFLTALAGMVLNIVFNLLLIPDEGKIGGALGAAIATLVSYAAVLILRMIDVPKILPFRLHLTRLCVSMALLTVSALFMTFDLRYRLWVSLGMTVLILAVNLPALLRSFRDLLFFRKAGRS